MELSTYADQVSDITLRLLESSLELQLDLELIVNEEFIVVDTQADIGSFNSFANNWLNILNLSAVRKQVSISEYETLDNEANIEMHYKYIPIT